MSVRINVLGRNPESGLRGRLNSIPFFRFARIFQAEMPKNLHSTSGVELANHLAGKAGTRPHVDSFVQDHAFGAPGCKRTRCQDIPGQESQYPKYPKNAFHIKQEVNNFPVNMSTPQIAPMKEIGGKLFPFALPLRFVSQIAFDGNSRVQQMSLTKISLRPMFGKGRCCFAVSKMFDFAFIVKCGFGNEARAPLRRQPSAKSLPAWRLRTLSQK